MRIDTARRLLLAKIVYCGPGLAGKTTNLALVRANAPAGTASELASEEAHSERTLHFHLQCTEFGLVHGMGVQAEFWTIPGQSYYAGTRRQLLAGADGVVFVADSRREALDENIESMNEMLGNLRHHGLPEDLPVVMQYNKQDAPTALKREQLDPLMNVRGWPSFAAVASEGRGVLETVHEVLRLMVEMGKAAEMPAAPPPRSWLIACHRCQAMLEVPTAAAGEVYTCGVCGSQLEVVDGDRGITRQPEQSQAAAVLPPDEYAPVEQAAQPHAAGAAGALEVGEPSPGAVPAVPAAAGAGEPAYSIPGFTVVAELDRSAQGVRHRVRETATGRALRALELAPALLAQPGYREQIEPYARLAGQVKHPNILPLVGVRTNGEAMVFLSADPPDHEPLSLVLARRRALAPPHAMGLLRQMALALEEGARHGAVHGWLRPDCVLVSGDGNVLLDELSVPVNHRFLVRELAGASAATEYYLAPEHLSDETRSDVRSDMFLLGAVLFRMMTGEGLVTGYNAHEALHKISANGPRTLRDAVQGISRELNIFYQKLVAVDRRERFQGYRELIDQLDRFGGGAKRQNLQLTAPQRAPGRPGQGGHGPHAGHGPRRPSSQHHGSGHGHVPASAGASTASRLRMGQPGAAAPAQPAAAPRRKGSGAGVGIAVAVVAILAAAVAVAVVVNNDRRTPPPANPEPAPPVRPADPPRAAPGPVAATPTPAPSRPADPPRPPAGTVPGGAAAPAKPPAGQGEAAARMELQRRIADLMVGERFAEASAMAARIEPVELRDLQLQAIRDRHAARRRELEDKVDRGLPLEDLGAALAPALTLWGMPGDDEWARTLMVRARTRDQARALPPPVPAATAGTATAAEVRDEGSAAAGVLVAVKAEPAAVALGQLAQALGANQPGLAQQALDAVPASTPEGRSLRLLAELWGQRIAFLQRLLGQRSRLRVAHPTTGDQWDLTAADAQGATLTSAAGSGSNLSWSQLPPRQQGKLFVDAALFPGAAPGELAVAVAMQLVADDPVQAAALMRRARTQLAPEQAADLERLIDLHQRRALVAAIQRGQEAVKRNDPKALDAALAEVRRADRQVQKPWQDAIAQLELVAAAQNARKK